MDDRLVVLRLYGLEARNGRIPTEAFTGTVRRFAATVAIFERAFTGRRNRSTDLNVDTLARENPMVVGLWPETRVRGYSPLPAVSWSLDEMRRIGLGLTPDPRVPLEALDNLVALSDGEDGDREAVAALSATFCGQITRFDEHLAAAAKGRRKEALARLPAPAWFAGMSKGTLLGELRGVTDLSGEREFFIKTPTTGRSVRCIFPEAMRAEMNRLLFQPVQIDGYLRYDGASPQPSLVEATKISDLREGERPHLFDRPGMFGDSYYPPTPDFPQ